jgi:putative ABC transport system permease protein
MKRISSFYIDAGRIAVQSIFAHKLRAFLTLIGIIIGVASVVVVGAAISGLNTYVVTQVSKVLGVNHFMMARMAFSGRLSDDEFERANRRNKKLQWEDYEWVRDNCKDCAEVGAEVATQVDLQQDGQQFFGCIIFGVTSGMGDIEDKEIIDGRFISTEDVTTSSHVCVLGYDIKDKFFPNVDPIGKSVKVAGIPMRVVGLEKARGSFLGDSVDRHIYIPISTHGDMFGRRMNLQIHGKGFSPVSFPQAIEGARTALRNKHKLKGNEDDDFGLVNTADLNKQIDQFTGMIAMVVTPITLISLVVGGIVVMNIMLVSVTERTFEIGLRKAIGATRRQILMQFLIESAILCALGGILGLVLSAGVAWLISATTPVTMTITLVYVLLALFFSGGIGLVAGIYPAFKASRLDPIIALTQN